MPFASASTTRAWRIFIGIALLALTVPRMTQRGMFGDGLLYATIAKNEGTGVGGFWGPTFTATSYTRFFEAPPLGIGLESLAFRLLGTHPAVERLFTLAVFLMTALLIAHLWRRLQPHAYDWWPLLLWLLPSIVTWATVNNMLEPTQTMFTTATMVAVVRAMQADSASAATAWSLLGALGVMAGVLTKGPVAFFPLGTPLVWWLTLRGHLSRAAAVSGVMTGVVVAGAYLLFHSPPARSHNARATGRAEFLSRLAPARDQRRSAGRVPSSRTRHRDAHGHRWRRRVACGSGPRPNAGRMAHVGLLLPHGLVRVSSHRRQSQTLRTLLPAVRSAVRAGGGRVDVRLHCGASG